ncbi:hypothetical protein L2E82_14675 [Cichorium intybus]|uniref:Uncharacterized protein n=1 Tax=Cichorium intybus TaxID=13427 RepID=A0ACB9F039_CICIN|nr:hypothetical protein L2E82_14675 [Cichorium intybus]
MVCVIPFLSIASLLFFRPARVTFSRSILKSQKFVPESLSVLDNSKYEIDSLGLTIPSAVEDPIKPAIENHEEVIAISISDLDNIVVGPVKDDLMIVGPKLEMETQEIDSVCILIPLAISDLIVSEIEEPIAVLEFLFLPKTHRSK